MIRFYGCRDIEVYLAVHLVMVNEEVCLEAMILAKSLEHSIAARILAEGEYIAILPLLSRKLNLSVIVHDDLLDL